MNVPPYYVAGITYVAISLVQLYAACWMFFTAPNKSVLMDVLLDATFEYRWFFTLLLVSILGTLSVAVASFIAPRKGRRWKWAILFCGGVLLLLAAFKFTEFVLEYAFGLACLIYANWKSATCRGGRVDR